MDLCTLRRLCRYDQARAAELAGVNVRTWRRWERHAGNLLAERWLRRELGLVPGWPPGWRAVPEGVALEDGRVVSIAMIEAAHWMVGLLERADRDRVTRWVIDREDAASGGA